MAIVKKSRFLRSNGDSFSPRSRDSMLSDDDELQTRPSASEVEGGGDDDDDGDVDSGLDLDGVDLAELGEIGGELCGVGDQSCSIPFELFDLPDLSDVLSLESWNDCLTEEERFRLTEYLPDMDQEPFNRTLKELFSGSNFHFGCPLTEVFDRLKGGRFAPRVALYQQGLDLFQKRKHYHSLRNYQNSMVGSLIQMRAAWENCAGYSIEERLRVLNIFRSQKGLMNGKKQVSGSETDSSAQEEPAEEFWSKKIKDGKACLKSRQAAYKVRPSADVKSVGRTVAVKPVKYGKKNPKGVLKVIAPKASYKEHADAIGHYPSTNHGLETKPRPAVSMSAFPWQERMMGSDLRTTRGRWQMTSDDEEEQEDYKFGQDAYNFGFKRNDDMPRGNNKVARVSLMKPGKKQKKFKKRDADVHMELVKVDPEKYFKLPIASAKENLYYRGKNRDLEQMEDRGPLGRKMIKGRSVYYPHSFHDDGKRAKNPEKVHRSFIEDGINTSKEQAQRLVSKNSHVDWSAGNEAFRHYKTREEVVSMDRSVKLDDWNVKSKKRKKGEFQSSKSNAGPDPKDVSYKAFSPHTNYSYSHSDRTANMSKEKLKRNYIHNGGIDMDELRNSSMYSQSDETESDSSEQLDEIEDEDVNHSTGKLGYLSGMFEDGRSTSVRSVGDPKKINKLVLNGSEQGQIVKRYSKRTVDHGKQLHMPEIEIYSSKAKHNSKMELHDCSTEKLERKKLSTSAKLVDDCKPTIKPVKNIQMKGDAATRPQLPVPATYSSERKRKGKVDLEYSAPHSNAKPEYENRILEEDVSHAEAIVMNGPALTNRSSKKGQVAEAHLTKADRKLLAGCKSTTQKQKGKVNSTSLDVPDESNCLQSGSHQPVHDPNISKKRGKKQVEAETVVPSDAIVPERGIVDIEPETKPPKKPFTLITPSIHMGFSFSIIHFLSAVRMAMITLNAEDSSGDGKLEPNKEEQNKRLEWADGASIHENFDLNSPGHTGQKNLPSLTVQEIVNRVRTNPGDPCILETQEPLQDLVRGILKIFSSKTAPLGAKGWKALVSYEKSTKSWSWIGPISSILADHECVEEETSPDAWGLPHKMLVKLVDAFAIWLKNGQETLQQIGSLPAPPLSLMSHNMDEKERFRDLRAQKSLTTISSSSDEVRAYFRREEVLRYSVPDRAFSYTAADGRKSIVAPLRRCGGKPTSKARDHFMLKPDRPPHVTILCLVRDAAARLPGSIGTRADVCTLIRDSQYIVEDVSDAQVNQVVSGALDRLHYERDPCVLFDGERKLWVYLHRDREEEDFEDDGTSSTKKWKRPRKDGGMEQSDMGAMNDVGYQGIGDQIARGSASGYDFNSDLNVELSSNYAGEKTELLYSDLRPNMEENMDLLIDSGQDNLRHGHPMGWEILELNPSRENKMLCLENSTNEDFDDETFSRERPAG